MNFTGTLSLFHLRYGADGRNISRGHWHSRLIACPISPSSSRSGERYVHGDGSSLRRVAGVISPHRCNGYAPSPWRSLPAPESASTKSLNKLAEEG